MFSKGETVSNSQLHTKPIDRNSEEKSTIVSEGVRHRRNTHNLQRIIAEGESLKTYCSGTYRVKDPDATLAQTRTLMPRLGITRIANITGLDRVGIPVAVAVRPNARSLATSQGKGDTLSAAFASALYESIELWHAERPPGLLRYDTWADIAQQHCALDPKRLPLRTGIHHFDIDCPIEWYEACDLFSGDPVWMPYELLSMNFVFQHNKPGCFVAGSNGLASGNTYSEAILHGMLEIIERDAWSTWEALDNEQRNQHLLDIDSVCTSSYLSEKIQRIEQCGLKVALWNITSDIGIPVIYCVIIEDPTSRHWRPIVTSAGCGASLDSDIAVSRALNEALQSRLTTISGSRDDIFPPDYEVACSKQSHQKMLDTVNKVTDKKIYQTVKLDQNDTFEQDISLVRDLMSAAGVGKLAVADLGREDIGIPVVRVIAENLAGLPSSGGVAHQRNAIQQQSRIDQPRNGGDKE